MPVDLAVTCSVHCWYNRKNGSLPHILILDEVLSVGDGAFRKKSEAKMREIIAGGATTILVSRFLAQVRELCTKVLWLKKGGQTAAGDTKILSGWYQKYLDKQITLEQAKNAWNRLNEHYVSDRGSGLYGATFARRAVDCGKGNVRSGPASGGLRRSLRRAGAAAAVRSGLERALR